MREKLEKIEFIQKWWKNCLANIRKRIKISSGDLRSLY
jgi:hypothetical protein